MTTRRTTTILRMGIKAKGIELAVVEKILAVVTTLVLTATTSVTTSVTTKWSLQPKQPPPSQPRWARCQLGHEAWEKIPSPPLPLRPRPRPPRRRRLRRSTRCSEVKPPRRTCTTQRCTRLGRSHCLALNPPLQGKARVGAVTTLAVTTVVVATLLTVPATAVVAMATAMRTNQLQLLLLLLPNVSERNVSLLECAARLWNTFSSAS
mmetsp:Transcript_18661/g.36916  ORF Transcript_18661/g.36916 Transcript_18661/m.36916 type:complete len:207 (-) Transcript_18661:157-777(-)